MEDKSSKQDKLVAPPSAETRMVAPNGSKVRLKAVRAVLIGERIVQPNEEFEVDASREQEFTRTIEGPYNFFGGRYEQADRAVIRRAVRV